MQLQSSKKISQNKTQQQRQNGRRGGEKTRRKTWKNRKNTIVSEKCVWAWSHVNRIRTFQNAKMHYFQKAYFQIDHKSSL